MDSLRTLVLSSWAAHRDRIALWVDGARYTYEDLIHHGCGIANAIIGTRHRTAILADRHFGSYAGILGAVLAGHAYVPLNPRHPSDRLQTMLQSADIGALVIARAALDEHRRLIETSDTYRIVVPDAIDLPDWTAGLTHRFVLAGDLRYELPEPRIDPHDGAYLLFTSGSTGTPKGVMVNQANVTAYVRTMMERYAFTPDDRATQLFDLTFDLSVHDLFVTWSSGGSLYCPSDTARKAPHQFVRRHQLTSWFSTPSTVAFMSRLRMLQFDNFPSLRISLFCGEALPTRLAHEWQQAAPRSLVDNLYGPTEATIAFTVFRVPADVAGLPDIVPIGEPLPGQQVAVFDENDQPATVGELCLSGSQVTEGYWRRPDLTRERFMVKDATIWYRTGDRAILDEDGLRFLGRLDRQVKISGHWVELMEVETALRHAAGCDSVAALPWPVDADGLAHGIVAIVAHESRADDVILAACRNTLPAYMMPSRLIRLGEWPLNTNGKTDYLALQRNLLGGP